MKGLYRNAINAMLAAAAMSFHKLLGTSWLYFLRSLLRIWSQFQLILASTGPAISSQTI